MEKRREKRDGRGININNPSPLKERKKGRKKKRKNRKDKYNNTVIPRITVLLYIYANAYIYI